MNATARWAVVAGACASAALTAYVGWHSQARVLIAPFVLWVAAPFVLLWWALARAVRWPASAGRIVSATAILVSSGTVAAYVARVIWPPRSQAAFVFVAVPPIAVALAAVAMLTGSRATARERPGSR